MVSRNRRLRTLYVRKTVLKSTWESFAFRSSLNLYIKVSVLVKKNVKMFTVLYFFQLFFQRFGRRKILMISFLVAAVGAIGALLLTDKAEDDQGTSST